MFHFALLYRAFWPDDSKVVTSTDRSLTTGGDDLPIRDKGDHEPEK